MEEEERNTKNAELDKLKALREKLQEHGKTNCWELVELNGDLPFRSVLGLLDKLWEVDIVLVRNFTNDVLSMKPLLFK